MFPYVEQKKTENPSSQEQRGGDCSHFYTCLRQRKWGCGSCFHRHAANNRGNWDSNKVIWPSDIHIFSKKMTHLSKCVVDSEAQWSTVPGSFLPKDPSPRWSYTGHHPLSFSTMVHLCKHPYITISFFINKAEYPKGSPLPMALSCLPILHPLSHTQDPLWSILFY